MVERSKYLSVIHITLIVLLLVFSCSALCAEESQKRVAVRHSKDGWEDRLNQTIGTYPVLKGMKILCVKRAMPKARPCS